MLIEQQVTEEVHVNYTVDDGKGYIYQDVLVLTPEEYDKLTEEAVEKLIIDKFAEWKAYLITPIPLPTDADKLKRLDQIARDQEALAKEEMKLKKELGIIVKG